MADLRGQRSIVWAVPVVLVVAVVAAALLLGGTDEAADPGADTSLSASASPAAPTTAVDPDTWCTAFRMFAEAQSQYVGAPDDPAAQQDLQDRADALLGIGRPIGLSPGGATALRVLVDGALGQAAAPSPSPGAAPQDDQALTEFLGAACPA